MDEGPFSCPYCSMSVRTRKGLKIHVRKIHIDGGRRRKSLPYSLKPLPERASIKGLYAPFVCVVCGFCCTANETLQVHCRSVHGFGQKRLASVDCADGKFGYFTTAVKARLTKSLTSSSLPPLCHVDASNNKSAVIYVPIHLTDAESQLLLQLLPDNNNNNINNNNNNDNVGSTFAGQRHHYHRSQVGSACPAASFTDKNKSNPDIESRISANTEPAPVDIGLLNDVLEFVCNEPKLSDSPEPQYRTFAVSEDLFEMIDINPDNVEVFEFKADFNSLMGRELSLHDTENSIEILVREPDGSTTVMTAVKRSDAKLKSLLAMADTNLVIE